MLVQRLNLILLDGTFAIAKLPPDAAIPTWASSGAFCSITRTADDLSIACGEKQITMAMGDDCAENGHFGDLIRLRVKPLFARSLAMRQPWFVVLAALVLGNQCRADETAAVKAIEKLGGSVTVDGKQPGKPVVGVDLVGTEVADASLKVLTALKSLQWVWLTKTQVTDAGLKELKDLKNLQWLRLDGTKVTGVGLKEFKSLQWLDLGGTQVRDAGLKELKELKGLRWLNLDDTQVTDAGMKELRELSNLQLLNLTATKLTDAGVKELTELKNLQALWLTDTQVTDAGVMELRAALPKLQITR